MSQNGSKRPRHTEATMSESSLLEISLMTRKAGKSAEMRVSVWPRNTVLKICSLSRLVPRPVSMSNNCSRIWQQIYQVFKALSVKLKKDTQVQSPLLSAKVEPFKIQDSNWLPIAVTWVPNKNHNKCPRTKRGPAAVREERWPSLGTYLTKQGNKKQIEIVVDTT